MVTTEAFHTFSYSTLTSTHETYNAHINVHRHIKYAYIAYIKCQHTFLHYMHLCMQIMWHLSDYSLSTPLTLYRLFSIVLDYRSSSGSGGRSSIITCMGFWAGPPAQIGLEGLPHGLHEHLELPFIFRRPQIVGHQHDSPSR